MYHPTIVKRTIARALAMGLIITPPVYHTRMEVLGWVQQINDLCERRNDKDEVYYDESVLTSQQLAFIENERFLCRVDFRYFVSRYGWIKDEEGHVFQFDPWISQVIFLDILAEMELEGLSIELIILKARQLGISAVIVFIMLHYLCFLAHINAFQGSAKPDKTSLLADMLEFSLTRLPFWLAPNHNPPREAAKQQGVGCFLEFDTGTKLNLFHGAQFSGIARGTTVQIAHLTEPASYQNAEDIVDSSILKCIHPSRRTRLFIEGTAEGMRNWFHTNWTNAKEGWPTRTSRLRPLFLPWYTGKLYPKAQWLHDHPLPDNWEPPGWVTDHADRAAEYVRDNPYMTKAMGEGVDGRGWVMPMEQMWYYKVSRDEAVRKNGLAKFLQEMPANDMEAFQNTNISVFEPEVIQVYADRCVSPYKFGGGVYGLLAPPEFQHERHHPRRDAIDPNRPPITVKWAWGTGYPMDFTLVPLKWDGWNTDNGQDKIYLWEPTEKGEIYGLGFDTADGIGKDSTVLEGMRKGNAWRRAAQICEFASNKMGALSALPYLMCMAAYYAVANDEMDQSGILLRQPRVAIECKNLGDETQNKMRLEGWSNFHPWQRIDGRQIAVGQSRKIGVYTNSWFRSSMIEYLVTFLRDFEVDVYSPHFVQEMRDLEGNWDAQDMRACYGGHDDRIMAMGFILISLYQWEKMRAKAEPKPPRYGGDDEKKYAKWSPGMQARVMEVVGER